jgi:archaellin
MHRFLAIIIAAPVMAIVAIAVGNLTTGKSGDAGAAGSASARMETAPIVLTQYNPCPNGKCR